MFTEPKIISQRKTKFACGIILNWSVIEGKPREVKVKGKIHAIIDDLDKAHYPPLSDYYTVTLYPYPLKEVYYLKFKTKEALERQAFTVDETVIVDGTLRCVDGKKILTNVKRSSEEF